VSFAYPSAIFLRQVEDDGGRCEGAELEGHEHEVAAMYGKCADQQAAEEPHRPGATADARRAVFPPEVDYLRQLGEHRDRDSGDTEDFAHWLSLFICDASSADCTSEPRRPPSPAPSACRRESFFPCPSTRRGTRFRPRTRSPDRTSARCAGRAPYACSAERARERACSRCPSPLSAFSTLQRGPVLSHSTLQRWSLIAIRPPCARSRFP
jgi:hypothetical protein